MKALNQTICGRTTYPRALFNNPCAWAVGLALLTGGCGSGGGTGGGGPAPGPANQNPTFVSPGAAGGAENSTQTGYAAAATDPDGDSVSYSITGGADASAFSIVTASGVLSFVLAPDFENPADANADNIYGVQIGAADGRGGSATLTLTVTISDVDEAPVFTSPATAVSPENTTQTNYLAVAADPEGGPVSYSLSGGADRDRLSINGGTGELMFSNPPDFESPTDANGDNDYTVQITAADSSGNETVLTLVVTVTDLSETSTAFWLDGLGPYGGLVNAIAEDSLGNAFVATGNNGCNGYACGRNGIFRSTTGWSTWEPVNEGLTNVHVNSLAVNSADAVYAGTYFGGVFKSTDTGDHWQAVNTGLPSSLVVDAIAIDANDTVFIGSRTGRVFRSANGGASWAQVLDITNESFVYLYVDSAGTVFASGLFTLFRSADGGDQWSGVPSTAGAGIGQILQQSSGNLLATGATGIFRSTNGGQTWSRISAGFPGTFPGITSIVELPGGDLIAGLRDIGFYRSVDNGLNWAPTAIDSERQLIAELKSSPGAGLIAATDGGIYRSADNGNTFAASNEGLANAIVQAILVASDGSVYAGSGSGVARSTDLGLTWTNASLGLPRTKGVTALFELPTGNLLAGTASSEIYRSGDNGASWQELGPLPFSQPVTAIDRDSTGALFVASGSGGNGSGAARSTDEGATWTPINNGLQDTNLQTLIVLDNDTIFTASTDIYRSLDGGDTWQLAYDAGGTVWQLTVFDNAVIAATSSGIVHSIDLGNSWSPAAQVSQRWAQAIAIDDGGQAYFGYFNLQPTTASIERYVYDSGVFVRANDNFDDNVRLSALALVSGPDGRVYAGLSGGGVAVHTGGQ